MFIDESKDRAEELARTYAAKTFRMAVKNYELTSAHHGSIKGYETYKNLVMTEADVERAADNAVETSTAGDPKTVLEKLDEVRRERKPQGMIPHLYTGGMPHDECVRSIRLFAKTCLNEVKSWQGAQETIDPPFAHAAE